MPPNYIGSAYVDKILNKNYHGTVTSKKWKKIWNEELVEHPELFETEILMRFTNRKDATDMEELIQRKLNVVEGKTFINESFANRGFSTKGYKYTDEQKKKLSKAKLGFRHTEEDKKKMSELRKGTTRSKSDREAISRGLTGTKQSEEHKAKRSASMKGQKRSEETKIKISEGLRRKKLERLQNL